MDDLSNGETTQVQEVNDSEQRYLTVYAVINVLSYAPVGAFIGWRGGINDPFTLGSGTTNGSIGGLILGAAIGIAFSIFLIGMS